MKIKSKSRKLNKAWLHDHLNDTYVKLAQKEGYRARAAYKLKEIDEELHLLRPGQVVVDLGAAPGRLEPVRPAQVRTAGAGGGGAASGELNGTHHCAGPAGLRADRRRELHPGRFPRRGGGQPARGHARRPAGGCGRLGPGAEPVGHPQFGFGAGGASGRARRRFRAAAPRRARARWSARCSTAAGTASSSSCSSGASGSSSRSSPRRRATGRRKPFWSASVSSTGLARADIEPLRRRHSAARRSRRQPWRCQWTGLSRIESTPDAVGYGAPFRVPGVCRSQEGAALNNQWFSKVAVWMVIALVLFTVFKQFDRGRRAGQPDRLLRLPRRSARQAHQGRHAAGGAQRDRDHRDDERRQAPAQHGDLPRPRPRRRPDQQRREVRRQAARGAVDPDEHPHLAGGRCCC